MSSCVVCRMCVHTLMFKDHYRADIFLNSWYVHHHTYHHIKHAKYIWAYHLNFYFIFIRYIRQYVFYVAIRICDNIKIEKIAWYSVMVRSFQVIRHYLLFNLIYFFYIYILHCYCLKIFCTSFILVVSVGFQKLIVCLG